MFCTSPDGEIQIPPVFEADDEYWWSYVRLPLFTPYFIIVCSDVTSECYQTFFLQTIDQVAQVVSNSAIELIAVQIVSPGHMNGTGLWQIDVLERVFKGVEVHEKDHKQFALVYVVAGGSRFLSSAIAKVEGDLTETELVLDLTALQNTSIPSD